MGAALFVTFELDWAKDNLGKLETATMISKQSVSLKGYFFVV